MVIPLKAGCAEAYTNCEKTCTYEKIMMTMFYF